MFLCPTPQTKKLQNYDLRSSEESHLIIEFSARGTCFQLAFLCVKALLPPLHDARKQIRIGENKNDVVTGNLL